MFAALSGFGDAAVDPAAKVVHGVIDLPAGAEKRFQFQVIVPRDAGGRVLTSDLHVRNLYLGAEFYGGAEIPIDTRTRTDGVALGGMRIAPAGLGVLAVLALLPLLALLFRSRTRSMGPIVAVVIAIGFWTLFTSMAIRDWRSLSDWQESSCIVRDSRLRSETASSVTTERSGSSRVRREATTDEPLLALEYNAGGRRMVSTGFDTGSRASIGGLGGALAEFSRWPIGGTVPCWFDSGHPEDVVVIRGFGGAYFFALFPLPLFLFGAWAIATGRCAHGFRVTMTVP